MPQLHDRINLQDLVDALRTRQWAFRQQRSGLCLTKVDKDKPPFKITGNPRRKPMIPVSQHHLDDILTYSQDLNEAIAQVEALSLGTQTEPDLRRGPQGGGVNMAEVESMINRRVSNEVAKATEAQQEMQAEIDKLKAERDEALKKAATAAAPKKKKVAKKTTKKTRKPGKVVERLRREAEAEAAGEPPLTEEQQEAYDAAMKAAQGPSE